MANNLLFKLLVLFCLAVPFKAASQSYDWIAIGDPNGGGSYFSMQFENQITGEIVLAFCGQNATTAPSIGDRYYLHANGEWLIPEDQSLQIMYIFQSECDYEKPKLEPLEECLAFENNITLTTNCIQGTPVWYRKASLELTETGRGNSITIPISWSHYYVRCENNDASCYSEFVHANLAYDYATAHPQPSKTNVCIGEEVNLSLESGCSYYEGYFDKWYLDELYTQPVNGSIVRPLTTTTYYLRCVNLSGCTANLYNEVFPVTITVDQGCTAPCSGIPNPTINGALYICAGGSTVLTAHGCTTGYTHLWSNNATTSSITVNTAGLYTVKCIQSDGLECESEVPAQANVALLPAPLLTLGTPVCRNGYPTYSVTFTVTEGASVTTSAGVINGNTITDIPSGEEVVVEATLGNCKVQASTLSNCYCVGQKPQQSESLVLCYGDTIRLSYGGSYDSFVHKWFNKEGVEVLPGDILIATESTHFINRYVSTNPGCEDGDSGMLEVTVKPKLTLSYSNPVCNENGTHYSVMFTLTEGATLTSDLGSVQGNTVSDIPSGQTATINVSHDGCVETVSVTHTCEIPCIAPIPSISGSTTICNGGSTILSAEGCTNGFSYLWSNNETAASITVNTGGIYTVKCINTSVQSCESLPSEPVTVVNVNSTLTAKTPLPICSGSTTSLSVEGCESGEITWSGGLTGNPAVTPPLFENTEYVATCTIGSCVSSITLRIGVNTEIIQAGTPVCSEDGLTYSVPFTISQGATLTSTTQGTINGTRVEAIPNGATAIVSAQRGCLVSTTITHTCDTQELFFDLALRKTKASGSKTIFKVGDKVTFDITVFNQGTVTATTVDLVDYIPTGLTLDDSNWTLDADKARWIGAVTNLLPSQEATVSITFTINSNAGEIIINTAEISNAENSEGLEDIDSKPDDDKDNDGPVKNDEIHEDGKEGRDEDDHDIEPISICKSGKCLEAKVNRKK